VIDTVTNNIVSDPADYGLCRSLHACQHLIKYTIAQMSELIEALGRY